MHVCIPACSTAYDTMLLCDRCRDAALPTLFYYMHHLISNKRNTVLRCHDVSRCLNADGSYSEALNAEQGGSEISAVFSVVPLHVKNPNKILLVARQGGQTRQAL